MEYMVHTQHINFLKGGKTMGDALKKAILKRTRNRTKFMRPFARSVPGWRW